jgi:hypothetical protein
MYGGTGFQNIIYSLLITSYGKQIRFTHFPTLRKAHVDSNATDKYSNSLTNLHDEVCRRFKCIKETGNEILLVTWIFTSNEKKKLQ